MKLIKFNILILLLALVLLYEINEVSAKKQKHGKGREKSVTKNNNYKENHKRKTRETNQDYIKTEKYNKKQESYRGKDENQQDNEQYNNKQNNNKNSNKKQEYNEKKYNVQYERQNRKGEIKEEIKKEFVDRKTEKYSQTIKQKNDKRINEPLNGETEEAVEQSKDENVIIAETPELNGIEEQNSNAITTKNKKGQGVTDCSCNKVQDKNTNKKIDSIERNTTKVCEKYKSEKNTKVIEEKVISDKEEKVIADNVNESPVVLDELSCETV